MRVWVIGAGRFGARAAERLSGRWRVTVVDPSPEALEAVRGFAGELVPEDGVAFLVRELARGASPDWIVPALPLHLAAEWALRACPPGRWRRGRVPPGVLAGVPNPVEGPGGDVYVSRATFLCPPECPEPADRCWHTGEPRGRDMYDLLTDLDGARTLVVRSRQLGAGIGGYRPRDLLELRERLQGCGGPVLVATACRCHGVITCLEPGTES